jgi:hypothetical protein
MRAAALACAVVALAGTARAEKTNKDRADDLFQVGRKQLEQKQFAQACKTFQAAYELDPDAPGTMLNLGLCNEELHRYSAALGWFRRAATKAVEKGFDPNFQKAANDHTAKLVKLVATVRISIQNDPPPANVVVKVDGEPKSESELAQVEVDPGHHVIDAKAAGMKLLHHEFDIISTGSDQRPIELAFEVGESSVIVDRGKQRRRIGVYAVIGGSALMIISAIYSKVYKDKYDQITSEYGTPGSTNPQYCFDKSGQDLPNADTGCGGTTGGRARPGTPFAAAGAYDHNIALWGNLMFFTGVAAVGTGIVLYVLAPSKERVEQTVFAPVLAPDHIGFAATGRF